MSFHCAMMKVWGRQIRPDSYKYTNKQLYYDTLYYNHSGSRLGTFQALNRVLSMQEENF